jgi:hypothetical protein
MHQHSILGLLGDAGYLSGKKLLQLFQSRDDDRCKCPGFKCGVAAGVPIS